MSITSEAQAIPLQPSSLYILTQPLILGAFHWSFIVTDATGYAVRHHWAAPANGSSIETYMVQNIGTAMSSTQNRSILAYFRVCGFRLPTDPNIIPSICHDAFPPSFPSVAQNRANGMTCRTWLLRILEKLRTLGYLARSDTMQQLEQNIVRQIQGFENIYLNAFVFQQVYMSAIVDV